KSLGAELISIKLKHDNSEYLWQGDSLTWGDHAILQFPIIGNLRDNSYNLNGQLFKMMSHGFARVSNFKKVRQGDDFIVYMLESDVKTQKMYPYDFRFYVQYKLRNHDILVQFSVENTGDEEMYFTLGYHPGFNCPLNPTKGNFDDYYLEFGKQETLTRTYLENNLLSDRKEDIVLKNKCLQLDKKLFKDDALVFEKINSPCVSLKSTKNTKSVTVKMNNAPRLGIWSPAVGGKFVCIEPWFGLADEKNQQVDFNKKKGMIKLISKQKFKTIFEISIQ
ncbi:MAG: aldose 1-epimerase family protein, partial [Paludibacter sp.]